MSFHNGGQDSGAPTLCIKDIYLPVSVENLIGGAPTRRPNEVPQEATRRLLTRVFGFEDYREGQFEAIERCLQGKDTILLLPTGAGKSVAYQLASLLCPGICIVVDPIVSLIEDQVENLRAAGIDRASFITKDVVGPRRKNILNLLAKGEYLFCFVAPERFQDRFFRESLRALTAHTAVSSITIDEAHCISEWGHDFRPAYLNIARISRDYCASQGTSPPLMALTGTASRVVLKDVQRELGIDDFEAIITPQTFDRAELRLEAIPCRSRQKKPCLHGYIMALPRKFRQTESTFFESMGQNTMSGLVFCPWVNSDYGVVRVAKELTEHLGIAVPFYSGGAPKNFDTNGWGRQKRQTALEFKHNKAPLMACTKAFGMGIDKPNIRYTVHYALPSSIESFYQEAGRAGRDRRTSHCVILYSDDYPERTNRLLNPRMSIKEIHEELASVEWGDEDDITRALFFHMNAFKGMGVDGETLRRVMQEIGEIDRPGRATISFDRQRDDRTDKEKALHRLIVLGVVSDYTVDYSHGEITLELSGISKEGILEAFHRYIACYQRAQAQLAVDVLADAIDQDYGDFVQTAGRRVIRFVYEVIERSRRQALSEMLRVCDTSQDETDIRERVLRYLGTSAFTERIEKVVDAADAGLASIPQMFDEVRSAIDAGHLRGEVGRALESYPDHAGLRLLRGVAEAMTGKPDMRTIRENVEACVDFATSKYDVTEDVVDEIVTVVARDIAARRSPHLARAFLLSLLNASVDKRATARAVVAKCPPALCSEAVAVLLSDLNAGVVALIER